MEILCTYNDTTREDYGNYYGYGPECGTIYNLLKCPSCKNINVASYFYNELYEEEEYDGGIDYTVLYPQNPKTPLGLPEKVLKVYNKAIKIKPVDIDAYFIMLRKVLEMVCDDRNAKGKLLYQKLEDLAKRNEIPEKLVKVANGLKQFGNISAHDSEVELSSKEVPIVEALCHAILEYIYSAPYLADLVEKKLEDINKGRKSNKTKN